MGFFSWKSGHSCVWKLESILCEAYILDYQVVAFASSSCQIFQFYRRLNVCLSVEICSYFLCLVFWCKMKPVVHSQLFQDTKTCKLWYWCEVIPALHNANAKVYESSWFFWEELYIELMLHEWRKKMELFLIALVKARQRSLIFAFSLPSYTQ